MRRPVIALNMDFHQGTGAQQPFSYLAAGYYDGICKAGGVPVLLPPMDEEALDQVLDVVDGCVLVGGADLDPRNDGFMVHPSMKLMASRREQFDRTLAAEIVERRLPVLAIGAGMQLLNVVCGGNLYFHLPEDLPDCLCHWDRQDPNHRHTLIVEPNSVVSRVYGEGEIRVTSRHHMAIDQLAPGFRVTARCPDGVIEAIESEMIDWFVIGTQFHPESLAASALDIRFFEEFIEGILRNDGFQHAASAQQMAA